MHDASMLGMVGAPRASSSRHGTPDPSAAIVVLGHWRDACKGGACFPPSRAGPPKHKNTFTKQQYLPVPPPTFNSTARSCECSYYFEERQDLSFQLYDMDGTSHALDAHDFIGEVRTSIGEIVGSSCGNFVKPLQVGGWMMVGG